MDILAAASSFKDVEPSNEAMQIDTESPESDSDAEGSYLESDVGDWNSLEEAHIAAEESDSDESERQAMTQISRKEAGQPSAYEMPEIPGEIDQSYRLSSEMRSKGFKRTL